MFRSDCHIHTVFSPDGNQTPEQMLKAAAEAGLTEITVTEHCECNGNAALPDGETPWPDLDVKSYTETFEKLKEISPIKINIGIELGQATQGKEYAAIMTAAYNWDFILGSLHNVRNELDFYYIDYKGKDLKKLFSELDTNVTDLTNVLLNKIIPNYENLSTEIKALFDNNFADKLTQLLETDTK